MTQVTNGQVVIAKEPKQQCDLCGRIAELRPYGPNGECVCFECGMKNEVAARAQFQKVIDGAETHNKEVQA
jgi:hypothetical protein